jgi:hypothetical protein
LVLAALAPDSAGHETLCGMAVATGHGGDWRFDGDAFADSFNQRRAITNTEGQYGYLKFLQDGTEPEPWLEQWANEEIVSRLADLLDLQCTEVRAGAVEGVRGAINVFMEGNKVSSLNGLGFQAEQVVRAAVNSDQFGLIVSLDIWIMNTDRGAQNVYITLEGGRPRVRLIDHGHTLLLPRPITPDPEDWDAFVVSGHFEEKAFTERLLGSNYLRSFVTAEEIVAGAGNITSLGDDEIRSAVEGVDEQFFFATRDAIVTLLLNRRDRLAACLEGAL